jgi:DNA-binding transcriptional LysR family regulator
MIVRHTLHESLEFDSAAQQRTRPVTNIATLDLNLLRVFDALYEERSVTRAGQRLGVTQSAVSHALHRLRELLGDELFNRTTEGMAPTAKAREIGPRLNAALANLHAALAETWFDPAVADTRFSIAADPYVRFVLLPRVVALLRQRAPSIELRIKPGIAGVTDALDSGRLDLVVASFRRVPERFGVQDLFHERLVWVMRADHPFARDALTLERLVRIPQLVRVLADDEDGGESGLPGAGRGLERRVIPDDEGALARAMAGMDQQRPVRLTIADSLAAMAVVGESDLAALVTERMAKRFAGLFNLALFDPPYESPVIPVSMVWHRGHAANPAAEWLRDLIMEVASEV